MPQQRDAYLTFSVDDGHPTDLSTAEMLARLGLQATFYVPGRNEERPVMGTPEIRELSRRFEIGSHTMNHRRVHDLNDIEAQAEVQRENPIPRRQRRVYRRPHMPVQSPHGSLRPFSMGREYPGLLARPA